MTPSTTMDSIRQLGNQRSAKAWPGSCVHCGADRMLRVERSFLDTILSRRSARCAACRRRQKSFLFTWIFVLRTGLILLVLGGGALLLEFATQPGTFLHQNAAPQSELQSLNAARNAVGIQLSPFEQMMARRAKNSLDNGAVLEMHRAGVDESVILQMIRNSGADYDLSPAAIVALRKAEVRTPVVLAMIDASYSTH